MKEYIKEKILEYGKLNGYVSEEDYYNGYDAKFLNITGYKLYQNFDSTTDAIRYCFPNFLFLEWKFKKCKSGWWQNIENQKEYLKWFEELKGIKSPEDWYNITYQNIKENYGTQILSFFSNSPKKIAKFLYPEYDFKFWKFKCSSMGDWDNLNNQKEYLKWFEELKGIKSPEDWYNITSKELINNYGTTLITNNYNNSVFQMLKILKPEYQYLEWKFINTPANFWNIKENQIKYLKWFEELKGIKSPEDWLNVTITDIINNYGNILCKKYKSSIKDIFNILYDKEFKSWEFKYLPDKFWNNKENVLEYIDWLEIKLNITCLDDWYNYTKNDILKFKADNLLSYYNYSMLNLLKIKYGENIHFWKFKQSEKRILDKNENKIIYLKWFEDLMNIKTPEDWYKIRFEDLNNNYGYGILEKFGMRLLNIAEFLYPDFNFEEDKFYSNTKTQGLIYQYVKEILEENNLDYEVHFNYKWDITYDKSNRKIELDIFIPELNLAIEYNGKQHYEFVSHFHRTEDDLLKQKERDVEKKRKCEEYNINFFVIKYDEIITKELLKNIFRF